MRLSVYENEPIVSEAVRFIFSHTNDIQLGNILGAASQIVPEVQHTAPDVLLLSLTPDLHLGILAQLHETAPCRIVLWARSFSREFAHQAMDLGVRGILQRTCSIELLIKCLHKVHEGELWFDRQLTAMEASYRRVALTPRQSQLAEMVADGLRNKEIADSLAISEGAVKVYLSHLFEKLGIEDRTGLAQLVARNLPSTEFGDPLTGATGANLRALYVNLPQAEHLACASNQLGLPIKS